ncbi:hypothetical protein Tco_0867614 [Tanacetum coccineum]
MLTESSSKNDGKENPFIPASLDYDHDLVVNERRQLTEALDDPESSKNSRSEPQTPLPPLNNLQGASSSSEEMTLTYQDHSPRERYGLGRVLAESSQSSESSIGVSYTCGSSVHSTTNHNDFEHLYRSEKLQASKAKEPTNKWLQPSLLFVQRHIREPIWYLDSGCSRSMTGVKSYLHKYVEQLGPKVVFGDNTSCITKGYGSINYGGIVFSKVAVGETLTRISFMF